MKVFYLRLIKLLFGLFLYALGIVITLKASIGYAPWEVFHVGLAKTTGISIGNASIAAGLVIGIAAVLLGEKLGLGTILNMILIGIFLDIILEFNFIPSAAGLLQGLPMLIAGLFMISLASYFYINSGFGAGPRDSLMVALTRKTKLPVGLCRGTIEILAVLVGWRLGGLVGIGTLISAFAIGFCIQTTFRLLKFDATRVRHETLDATFKTICRSSAD
ncbi:MAG TPA: hypothetical protein VLR72_03700 [Clostridiaceae bacterium]|nr:hypothetical protein [Clostridiaceae bacterium]